MKMSSEQIQAVASMLTDDPDVLVNEGTVTEFFGGRGGLPPALQGLSAAFGIKDPGQLQSLQQEMQNFAAYRPSLKAQGEQAILQAFVQYKKTGKMPQNPGAPADLDSMGGSDFRSAPDQAVRPGKLRQGGGRL